MKNRSMKAGVHVLTLGVYDLEESFHFYKDGLGFPTKSNPDGGVVLLTTSGAKLFLYPYSKLAKDAGIHVSKKARLKDFPGFTLGYAVREKSDVDEILRRAAEAGGSVVKPAKTIPWGWYSGYFSDLDGYLWEVAYSKGWKFTRDGNVILE